MAKGDQEAKEVLDLAWVVLMLQGIVAILFGIAVLVWPGLTLGALVVFFALFLIITSIFDIVVGLFSIKENKYWYLQVIKGVIGIIIGVFAFNHLDLTMVVIYAVIAVTMIVKGVLEAVGLYDIEGDSRGLHIFIGVINILFGLLLLFAPTFGVKFLILLIGIYSLVAGPLLIALSLQVKSLAKEIE